MAKEIMTVRIQAEYKKFVEEKAVDIDRSQGYVVEQGIYRLAEGNLPRPASRDRKGKK